MARKFHFLALFFLLIGTSRHGSGSRTIVADPPDFAVELDANTFNSTLASAPARWAIVEFFAHWCPACRNYKPQYERVARLFNGPNAVHPGTLFMAKVDCALKVNNALCERFKISRYPTLLWAPASKSAWVDIPYVDWEMVENAHKAELLLQSINKKLGRSYTLEDTTSNGEYLLKGEELDLGQVAISNYDIEEATSKAMDIILSDKLLNHKTRPAFIQFLQLLIVHHPSKNCRKGSADVLMSLEDAWTSLPKSQDEKVSDAALPEPDYDALKNLHICGEQIPRGYWISCRGSLNDTRGYSCGLWLLFHALSVRIEDRLASSAFQTVCNFVGNFFNCKECSEHFLEYCSSAKMKVASRRQFAMWLWDIHNQVNVRLAKEEESLGTGDPMFKKQLWPPVNLCKSCWKSPDIEQVDNQSNDNLFSFPEVYNFLLKYYGHALSAPNVKISSVPATSKLSNVPEPTTRSTVTVPVAAALAIAFASCGFGAVACFWRTRQKKRKYGGVSNR